MARFLQIFFIFCQRFPQNSPPAAPSGPLAGGYPAAPSRLRSVSWPARPAARPVCNFSARPAPALTRAGKHATIEGSDQATGNTSREAAGKENARHRLEARSQCRPGVPAPDGGVSRALLRDRGVLQAGWNRGCKAFVPAEGRVFFYDLRESRPCRPAPPIHHGTMGSYII